MAIRVPGVEEVYKNKGKMYIFKRTGEAVGESGFIADGTLNPIFFHLWATWIRRGDISLKNVHMTWRRHANDAEEWQYQKLVKVIFNPETKIKI